MFITVGLVLGGKALWKRAYPWGWEGLPFKRKRCGRGAARIGALGLAPDLGSRPCAPGSAPFGHEP